jgi:pimeloyl-ACP methyl ester carboxylesterase
MTFVLIPGAGGNAWFWSRLEPELRRRGHDVVAVDLPSDDESVDISGYTDVTVKAIGDRTDLVVVAHSLAGFTGPLVCDRRPARMLVLLNAMIPISGETAGHWWSNTGQPQARAESDRAAGRDPDAEFDFMTYFFHDATQDVIDEMDAHARPQSNGPFAEPWPLSAWPDVPTRVLVGRDDRFFPATFQRRVAEDRLGITPDETPGGHLPSLSYPSELADRLEGYLT